MHPERAARIEAIEAELAARDWLGYEVRESPPAERADLLTVHPEAHVASIEALCAAGGGHIDVDTLVSPGSYTAALHAVGGAVALVDLLLAGEHPTGFSAHRPPGHHAETDRAMGFCLFSTVAVAARRALSAGVGRVLVLDWDVHHGNGTQEVFYESPDVLFASIHEWPLYPGTGHPREIGRGAGEGRTLNMPVPAGSGDEVHASLVEHVVLPLGRDFEPGLILISAGFDAHAADPLAGCRLTEEGFATMTRSMRRLGAELDVPVGVVLEGGYGLRALADSVAATLVALAAEPSPGPEAIEVHPLARAAGRGLAGRWPSIDRALAG